MTDEQTDNTEQAPEGAPEGPQPIKTVAAAAARIESLETALEDAQGQLAEALESIKRLEDEALDGRGDERPEAGDEADGAEVEGYEVEVGDTVLYDINERATVPMLITKVHDDGWVDGIAFSAEFRVVGNYRGAEPQRRISPDRIRY